jgi:protoporphyrinogen oxidase
LEKFTILGAGLAGISSSYHLGHSNCRIFEKNSYAGGHIHSWENNGFTWDEGPHVSFTKHAYVRDLFEENVKGQLLEYPVETSNFYQGHWIPHPAQSNLWAVPEPLRRRCLEDFQASRKKGSEKVNTYKEWLIAAFGQTFYEKFPRAYTKKYWTVDPRQLTVDWVGERVFFPNEKEVEDGYLKPLLNQTHYIKEIRYPKKGGYFSFGAPLYKGSKIDYNKELRHISFDQKKLTFNDGSVCHYEKLISSIPLPVMIERSEAPIDIKMAARRLNCSSVLLVNVVGNHPTRRKENWMYVYDEDKLSTRINCTELLSPSNGVSGKTGVQVEVYFSDYKKKIMQDDEIAKIVSEELIEMGIIKSKKKISSVETKWVQWANVIFDHQRKDALDEILSYLETKGLEREDDDLSPMTNWGTKSPFELGDIVLAGRFAQWKYYWTDDCVLRGRQIELGAT